LNTGTSPKNNSSSGPAHENNTRWNELQPFTPLTTKIYIPPLRSAWISRSRLISRMNEGFERKLTLLSAPAGFGKTTLLVDWIYKHKIPVAWFSVDKADDDPVQFLTYIILGLQRLRPGTGKAALAMLQSPQPPPIESTLINLVNDLILMPRDFAIILDDYHSIDSQPIHDMIAFLLENNPKQMHMIIATRSDPPLQLLSLLRSQNQLTELRAADLGFTDAETENFLNKSFNLHLSAQEIDLLEAHTEGWIAGLQLAALSLKGHKDPSGFLQKFKGDNRYIADYLTEEVLNRQSEQLRTFLLQTSILRRLSAPLCNAVTCQKNSRQILTSLEKDNLFLIPLDEERSWYRYHNLFGDLLEQQLRVQQEDSVLDLHRRASQWLAENGLKNEAVRHAFAAQNHTQAAQFIEEIAEMDWHRARESRLLRWFKALPDEYIGASPKLCIFFARELFHSGLLNEAENMLQAAEKILESASDQSLKQEYLTGRIAVIRAYMCTLKEDASGIVQYAKQALHCLPLKDSIWRSVAAMALGFGYGFAGLGDFAKANQAFSEAMEISREAGNIYVHIFAGSCLGGVMGVQGQLRQAHDICQKSLKLAGEHGLSQTGNVGSLYGTLGWIFGEWYELDQAVDHLSKGIELSIQGRDPVILASSRWNLMKTHICRGDYVAADRVRKDLNEGIRETALPIWMENTVSAFTVMHELMKGNIKEAVQWVKERGLNSDDKLDNRRQIEYLALAEILIAQNRLDEADSFLQRLIENARAGDIIYMMIQMLVLRALVLQQKGDTAAALIEMELALSLAEPGGFITIFVSRGKPVIDFLEQIILKKKKTHTDTEADFSLLYVRRILSAWRAGSRRKNEDLIESLSERELEVLQLIAAGLSNKAIAEKLFISLNTVKTHTKNINSKLNVNSRIKAAARAKALGLL